MNNRGSWDGERRRSGLWDPMNTRGLSSWDPLNTRGASSWDPLNTRGTSSWDSDRDRRYSPNGYDRPGYDRSGYARPGYGRPGAGYRREGASTIAEDLQFFLQEKEVQRDALANRINGIRNQSGVRSGDGGGYLTTLRNRGDVEGNSNRRVTYVLEQELAQKSADIEYLRQILAKAVEYGV